MLKGSTARVSTEDSLIARYFKPLATHSGALGLVDDAAFLTADGSDLVITTDAIVEGVHFLPDDRPDTIARKALRVNLSDLAAKGAVPAGFTLTLALREINDDFLGPFARALGEDAEFFQCPLLGGDTVSTPGPLMISVTAFGRAPRDRMVRRDAARVGDAIVVTGTIGDAALGLALLQGSATLASASARAAMVLRYRVPQPRTSLAAIVRDHAHAAMDVSDGLAGDLAKLCRASRVSASVDIPAVPLSAPAMAALSDGVIGIEALLAGGDDYEILCTIPQNRLASFMTASIAAGVAVAAIGEVVGGEQVPVFRDAQGEPVAFTRLSYSHF